LLTQSSPNYTNKLVDPLVPVVLVDSLEASLEELVVLVDSLVASLVELAVSPVALVVLVARANPLSRKSIKSNLPNLFNIINKFQFYL